VREKEEKVKLEILNKPQAVEQLIFQMRPEAVERWLALDHEIWSRGLAKWPGYVRKEIWQSLEHPGRLTVTIYWDDYDAWKAVDSKWLAEVDEEFTRRFAPEKAEIIGAPHEVDQNFLIAESGGLHQ
jgi:uncharacterized protein (TIGR03792 family)